MTWLGIIGIVYLLGAFGVACWTANDLWGDPIITHMVIASVICGLLWPLLLIVFVADRILERITIGRFMLALLVCVVPSLRGQEQDDFQIMPPSKIALIKNNLPRVEPGPIHDALVSPDAIWYDNDSMGVMIQAGAGGNKQAEFQNPVGLFSTITRLGVANGLAPRTLANMTHSSFPWQPIPGGTEAGSNSSNVKLFVLPKRASGRFWPVAVFPAELEGFSSPRPTVTGIDWMFPVGTVFLEFFTVDDTANNQHYVCIIRARMRLKGGWAFDSAAPYRTADEFASAIQLKRPHWREQPDVAKLVRHLLDGKTKKQRFSDETPGNLDFNTKPGDAFSSVAQVDTLPEVDPTLIAELLDTTIFRSCSGYEWKYDCHAPTTTAAFHIVPTSYRGAFISIDSFGCVKCHNGAAISARRNNPNNGKDGWGRGSRSEDILSWHPCDPILLTNAANREILLRQKWVDAGIVAVYRDSPTEFPESVYQRLKN